jgi:hypothetical protein
MKSIVLSIIVLCLAVAAGAQTPPCLEYAAMMPVREAVPFPDSVAEVAAVLGDDLIAIYGEGRLDIIDISDREQPVRLARLIGWHDVCLDMVAYGSFLYCGTASGVQVVEVSDPTAPVFGSMVSVSSSRRVAIGDLLAVASDDGVRLYSLADPTQPSQLAVLPAAEDVSFLDENRLVLLTRGFAVVDVTDPAAPEIRNEIEYPTIVAYQYFSTTHVCNLYETDGLLVGRCEFEVQSGSQSQGTYRVTRTYSRRLFDPSNYLPEEIQQEQLGQTSGEDVRPRLPDLRRGDFLIDDTDVVDLSSGSLLSHARLPLVDPIGTGLLPGPDGETVVITESGLLCVPATDLLPANAVNVPVNPGDIWSCGGGQANEQLWINRWSYDNGDNYVSQIRYGFGPGEVTEELVGGIDIGAFWLIDDLVLRNMWQDATLYRVSPEGVETFDFPFRSLVEVLDGPDQVMVTIGQDLLELVDLEDPASPVFMGSLDLAGAGYGTFRDATLASDRLLIGGTEGLALVSIADPWQPEIVSSLALGHVDWARFWTADLAIAQVGVELLSLDFSDPAAPTVAFAVPAGDITGAHAFCGDHGYFIGGTAPYVSGGWHLHLLELETLTEVGVAVFNARQHSLHVSADGSLAAAGSGNGWTAIPAACEVVVTPVEDGMPALAAGLGVYPNPFNPQTSVMLRMAAAGPAELSVYDPRGRLLRRFDLGSLPAGEHRVTWNGRDDSGRELPAGVYLLRLTSPGGDANAKAVLVR